MKSFEPKIVGFLCNWCSYEGADSAGKGQKEYPPNVRIVRVMCSGRIDPQFVLKAFQDGADGVMVLGCHPGDCHYKEGNYNALRRYALLKKLLAQFGIEDERLRLDWVSASEGEKFVQVVTEMVSKIKALGPFGQPDGPEQREQVPADERTPLRRKRQRLVVDTIREEGQTDGNPGIRHPGAEVPAAHS
jgi:F420-non-reducing hydrogenase iron-sulfur subunit